MAALLATPRHKANAIMKGTMRIPPMEVDTLYGYTFRKDGGPAGPVEDDEEVRQGLARWQADACDLVMNVEDLDAERKDRNGCTTMHLAAAAGNRMRLLMGMDGPQRTLLLHGDGLRCYS
ncbi:hypothetical protein Pmar_PMAR016979 [Perkinsus marinus ATCC 50983]|uniref:Uncharacterized protein n=1 Tax=Perkinsus marinus (strain ATCC 50983 / TXsc) TaxID=423536 RepID=C5L281_PERM5|nr:hypothetical protein Pmar_PMAR016979 [Perkinsus marinus ATCC 50983]EER09162.1 hypothetical protein Pmar_PMAR016979 [Perkinsus marinus ATCC 50983]|eukprot:XP_002777346.1 hypothetical protein Pmar_PMAR016979 [Perkinsus marinus ATCC 50983]